MYTNTLIIIIGGLIILYLEALRKEIEKIQDRQKYLYDNMIEILGSVANAAKDAQKKERRC